MKNLNFPLTLKYPAFRDSSIKNNASQEKGMSSSVTKKVLVIDYNEAILDVLKIIITDAGYTFLSPLSALIPEKISALQPDLILIEDQLYNLPEGRKISRNLKRSVLTSSIPIVMMTTAAEPKDLISESQADILLIKPFEINNLEAVLHRCSKNNS